jgi:hypothetical protein
VELVAELSDLLELCLPLFDDSVSRLPIADTARRIGNQLARATIGVQAGGGWAVRAIVRSMCIFYVIATFGMLAFFFFFSRFPARSHKTLCFDTRVSLPPPMSLQPPADLDDEVLPDEAGEDGPQAPAAAEDPGDVTRWPTGRVEWFVSELRRVVRWRARRLGAAAGGTDADADDGIGEAVRSDSADAPDSTHDADAADDSHGADSAAQEHGGAGAGTAAETQSGAAGTAAAGTKGGAARAARAGADTGDDDAATAAETGADPGVDAEADGRGSSHSSAGNAPGTSAPRNPAGVTKITSLHSIGDISQMYNNPSVPIEECRSGLSLNPEDTERAGRLSGPQSDCGAYF